MKKYNFISLSSKTGSIRLTVKANGRDEAILIAENVLNCYVEDEYFIEESKITDLMTERQTRIIY